MQSLQNTSGYICRTYRRCTVKLEKPVVCKTSELTVKKKKKNSSNSSSKKEKKKRKKEKKKKKKVL